VYHELYESTSVIKRGFITLSELEKIFYLFSNSIDWDIIGQSDIRFEIEKSFKSYLSDQWLLCREQTWFNMIDILHDLILNQNIIDEMILITLRNQSLKG
jgi:hypothetical protein